MTRRIPLRLVGAWVAFAAAGHPAVAEPSQPVPAFACGITTLEPGARLDLDAEATDHQGGPASEPEVAYERLELRWCAERRRDDAFSALPSALGAAPWWRVATDGGRVAWVQVLRAPRSPRFAQVQPFPPTVRWFVARRGLDRALPAPGGAFCVGRGESVEVWFEPRTEYVRYRVDRREGPDGPFRGAGEIARPPFIDREVRDGVRYAYRVVGIADSGAESLPRETFGTTASRGVLTGTVEVERRVGTPDQVDLVAGTVVADGGDLVFEGGLGGFPRGRGAARFRSASGLTTVTDTPGAPAHPWPECDPDGLTDEIPRGHRACVPLRGGGVARFTYDSAAGRHAALVSYEVLLDDWALPREPDITVVEESARSIRVQIRAPVGGDVVGVEVVALDRPSDGPAAAQADDGGFAELPIGDGRVFEVRATCADRHGRRWPEARRIVDRRPDSPIPGTIDLGEGDGFSFASMTTVQQATADLVYLGSAGSGHTVILSAACGITNVEAVVEPRHPTGTRDTMFRSIRGIDGAEVSLGLSVDGNSRIPESDVLLVRTRSGGWAKVVIDERTTGRDPRVRGRYVLAPHRPEFEPGSRTVRRSGGILWGVPEESDVGSDRR